MTPSLHQEIQGLRRRVAALEGQQREAVGVTPPRTSVRAIIAAAAEEFGVEPAGILSARRTRDLVVPRQVAMTLAVELLHLSTTTVGRQFGRDHTTVLHAQRCVTALRADPIFAARVARVRKTATTNPQKGAAT